MGSLVSLFYLPFLGIIKVVLVFGVFTYFIWNISSQRKWHSIGQDRKGWYLQQSDEKSYITLAGDSTVTGLVTILRFTRQGKYLKESSMIFKDSLPADLYRQLIVRLKYFNRETG